MTFFSDLWKSPRWSSSEGLFIRFIGSFIRRVWILCSVCLICSSIVILFVGLSLTFKSSFYPSFINLFMTIFCLSTIVREPLLYLATRCLSVPFRAIRFVHSAKLKYCFFRWFPAKGLLSYSRGESTYPINCSGHSSRTSYLIGYGPRMIYISVSLDRDVSCGSWNRTNTCIYCLQVMSLASYH